MASRGQQRQGHVRMRGTKQTKRTILIWHICFYLVFDNKPSNDNGSLPVFEHFSSCRLLRALPHWLVKNTMASLSPHQAASSLKHQGENIRGKKYRISLPVADSLQGPDTQFPTGKFPQRFVYSVAGRTGPFTRSDGGDFHPKPHSWRKKLLVFSSYISGATALLRASSKNNYWLRFTYFSKLRFCFFK